MRKCIKITIQAMHSLSKVFIIVFSVFILSTLNTACRQDQLTRSGLNSQDFSTQIDGQPIDLFVLKNKNGAEACITNYGARLVSLMMPDKNGRFEDIVCGFSNIDDYLNNKQNFGATIGRYIGRILNSTFTLDSIVYNLSPNTGEHCAHGGNPGFANKIWTLKGSSNNELILSLLSPDGENGFPGNLSIELTYTLTDNNELDIKYIATTDKPTVVNLSHHSFFNLSGDMNKSVENQIMYINADYYTPYDSLKCVTGEIMEVENTPFDFRVPQMIGDRIDDDILQLNVTKGYDHNWVLNTNDDEIRLAARLIDKISGRTMEVYTNEPGLQVFTANGLKGALVGKSNIAYQRRTSICFETQHFPDSPNKPNFPSTVLRPGETYYSRCIYRFGIDQ